MKTSDLQRSDQRALVRHSEDKLPSRQHSNHGQEASRNAGAYRTQLRRVLRNSTLFSLIPFLALVAGLTLFPIPGAVIGNGYVTFESAAKTVQAPETGVIEGILVRDGDLVTAGQSLIRMDSTAAATDLAIITKSMDQVIARIGRLEAETLDRDELTFDAELVARNDNPEVAAIIGAERQLFQLRQETYRSQLSQMQEQRNQIDDQVIGLTGQLAATREQATLLGETIEANKALVEKQLALSSQLSELRQRMAILQGQISQMEATMALAKGRKAQLDSEIAELRNTRMSDASSDLRQAQISLMELAQRRVAAASHLDLLDIRSPQDGTVTNMQVRTPGGVVSTTETLMTIAPLNDRLISEIKISPRDAPHVFVGQPVELHFSAIGGANAPIFAGEVTFVSPDVVFNEQSGVPYFTVRTTIGEPINDPARTLVAASAGTPVEVFLLREAQPVFAFIARPLFDQAQRAFR